MQLPWMRRTISENRLFVTILIISAAFAASASLFIGLHQSVWFDEAYSILLAKHSVAEIVRLTGLDTHPPFYYLLLKGWAALFGWSELALRVLSVLSMSGALVVGGLLVRKMFGNKVAVGTIALIALSPLLLRYGFEIRMYSLASFIGVSATYCLYSAYKSKQNRRKWLVGYGLLVALGMFSLYYLALLWIAHAVWLVSIAVRYKWRVSSLAPYLYAYIGAIILFSPWLPTFMGQVSNDALAPIGQPMNYEQLSGVISFNTLYQPTYGLTVILTVVILAFIATIIWSIKKGGHVLRRRTDELSLLGAYIGVPIVMLMGISLVKSMYTERYLSHVAISLVMLVGIVVSVALAQRLKHSQRIAAIVVVYGTMLIGFCNIVTTGNFNFQRNEHPSVKQAAATIHDCGPGSQIVAADPYVMTELSYYVTDCQTYFVSQWPTLAGGYAPWSGSKYQIKSTSDITSQHVTYVYYGTPDQAMPASYKEVSTHAYGSLNVTIFKR
ncbi:MAG TPA: glycosyltransferase family 39 protein [Patescibacteria group bacterium]|nr:glycosyltransferase family 39 protein [Patescibacteria group bacterium]